ncbi:hypothetical protein AYL99_05308 [Fonsecaea erecta]|uniref:Uncharacterized protein n=1 Tax=Fonsecaea erecta TaxID=1367422 RepID=A0A178ZLM5_9EURO|nr:hypothetical protein AYL99_05308 [Fonsecaea erecta]OAP60306.1 hypothetical protein AYL99_05308 [Fonsecaea erecta]
MSIERPAQSDGLSPTLLDVLSISIILDNTVQYLPLSTLFALARTSRAFRDLILRTASVFRYVDLSKCRGAYVPPSLLTRIDSGGHSWRAERMDENLTEDEFYAGPLRGVLARLAKMKVLQNVQTLVLDGLASVTVDLINDIVTRNEYNVRFLSCSSFSVTFVDRVDLREPLDCKGYTSSHLPHRTPVDLAAIAFILYSTIMPPCSQWGNGPAINF